MNIKKQLIHGFTIVELLIVIAIIGILTTIVAVSYNGVQNNAIGVSLQSDLSNASDFLRIDQARSSTGSFPDTLALANGGKGIPFSSGTSYPTYVRNNSTLPHTFCLTATKSGQNYFITQEGTPMPGVCPILYLDAGIATSYPGNGTTWFDLSGNGDNGTFVGSGITYSNSNGGVLSFPGVTTRVETNQPTYGNTMTWTAWINCTQSMGSHNMFMGRHLPYFSYRSGNSITFSNSISGTQRSITTASNLALMTWYYTAFTTEYNGTNTTMRVYINGSQVASGAYAGTQDNLAYKFAIGDGGNAGVWYPFNGLISNVKVYNYTLSADEVGKNFSSQRGVYGI